MLNLQKLKSPENVHYIYALKQEINRATTGNAAPHTYPPSIDLHPLINNFRNKNIFNIDSNSEDGWYHFLLKNINQCKLGLSLGSGDARHEKRLSELGLVKKWVNVDLAENPLDVFSNSGGNEFIYGDLNFLQLPKNKFDFVYCNAFIHHIVNLEHLFFQIYESLTPEGVLVVYEYAGENKWQWSEEKYSIIKTEVEQNLSKEILGVTFKRPSLYFMSERPFESIRSSEIHSIVNNLFIPKFEKQWNRIIYPFINSVIIPRKYRGNERIISCLIESAIELEVKNNINLMPTELNGIYQKKENPILTEVVPWTEDEIKENLGRIKAPILYIILRHIKNILRRPYRLFVKFQT
jgi:SAM-dependent methyltransferase